MNTTKNIVGYRGHRTLLLVAGTTLAAATFLAGCSMGSPESTVTPSSPTPTQSETASGTSSEQSESSTDNSEGSGEGAAALQGVAVTAQEAGVVALDAQADGRVVEIELEYSGGKAVWEVKVVSAEGSTEVLVDVSTGQVVGEKDRSTRPDSEALARLDSAKLDFAQAIGLILAEAPGEEITEISLDTDRGTVTWEAELVTAGNQKREIYIDAVTGDVLKNEIDD